MTGRPAALLNSAFEGLNIEGYGTAKPLETQNNF